jgi:hypothetical protein
MARVSVVGFKKASVLHSQALALGNLLGFSQHLYQRVNLTGSVVSAKVHGHGNPLRIAKRVHFHSFMRGANHHTPDHFVCCNFGWNGCHALISLVAHQVYREKGWMQASVSNFVIIVFGI